MSTHLEKHCGRFPNPEIVEDEWLVYRCPACGLEGRRDVRTVAAAAHWNDLVAPGWRDRVREAPEPEPEELRQCVVSSDE